MNLLSVSKLSRMGREAVLFDDLTFGLDEGEKIALIGKNGSGKSTLLKCIAGVIEPDKGIVVTNKEAGVSFLPQNPVYLETDTITDHIFKSDSPKLHTIRNYEKACSELAENPSGAAAEVVKRKLEQLTHEMDSRDLWNYENSITSILTTLGITNLERKMGTLSGGMIKKVALAQVLIEDTKILLLDEPTNHLDISTIAWLEEYLKQTTRSVLMVTHDRYFLDGICTSIYELEHSRITLYSGNFSRYLEKKAIAEEIAANADARIESVLRTEREWLLRGPQARGTKAKARIDSIHKMINREKFSNDKGFSFEVTGRRLGGKILETEGLTKSYNSGSKKKTVISDFSYIFKKGEKIGIFGDNGSGKTTLLNMLTGELTPDSGKRSAGENTVFAYYHQNPIFEDTTLTVLEYIKETAEVITKADGTELTATKLLEQFGFDGKIQHSPVSTLSGGERKRVYLVRLLMSNPNFLVLDEPTNDFDIYTMSVLESFLVSYQGCLLVVSHDRYFMDRVADTLFILAEDGTISGFVGTCSEYLVVREDEKAEQEAAQKQSILETQKKQEQTDKSKQKPKKRTFKEEKEYSEIEKIIEKLEEQKDELEALLSGGETDHLILREVSEKFTALSENLEKKYQRWEYLASFD
ncbi:MAG TPA: ATP-binding cassette domain-containing protein [Treponemataceae bacterium]|nr:ATP-binding cassette domain-containing protein [Treponemataceae bacterium]